jgi:hypothetical protein
MQCESSRAALYKAWLNNLGLHSGDEASLTA